MSSRSQPTYRINLRPYRILFWPLLLPVALLLALFNKLSPVPFMIYALRVERVGQMAANQEEFLCMIDNGLLPREFRVFIHRDKPSNGALLTVLKRAMPIRQIFLPLFDICHKLGGLGVTSMYLAKMHGDDARQLAACSPKHVELSDSEIREAEAQYRALGLDPGKPFIAVLGRDSSYLSSLKEPTDDDSYRNMDINTFIPAMEYLADRFQVLRIGSVVKHELQTEHPGIFDYSASGKRTELLDVYLSARCHFFLSPGTGLDTITSNLFRGPVQYACFAPANAVYMLKPWTCFIPKQYWLKNEGRYLTLSELLETGIGDKVTPRELTPLDITIHENTPEEVLDAVKEMVARLDGTWIETDEMRQRQERFRAIFKKYRPEQKMTARINDAFLLKNPNWLE